MAAENDSILKNLIAYIQRKSFIWGPEPEIYNGIAGFYTYGPLGKELKNNVENTIRKTFKASEFWEVECPTVAPAPVWKASGHLDGFTDPVITCSKCNANFRADNLLEEFLRNDKETIKKHEEITGEKELEQPVPTDKIELLKLIKLHEVKCPSCKTSFCEVQEIKQHNLMMKTTIGLDIEAYNRPETATTTYLPFPRYLEFFRDKLPFGVFQIGKAYRNEISPRQFVLRSREFTQAEGQLFIFEEQKQDFEKFDDVKSDIMPMWSAKLQEENKEPLNISLEEAFNNKFLKNKAYAWTLNLAYRLFKNLGIPENRIRLRQHCDDEKAFYADDAWDIELKLSSFGWTEVCGVHDRTSYDLNKHSEHSGKNLQARNEQNEKKTPHVLEIAFGTDRPTFALLDIFYSYDEEKKQDTLKIPAHIAPVKVSVLPLVKKDGLSETAKEIYSELREIFECTYDHAGSIGRRYARNDEIGTPFCLTIDYDTLDKESPNFGTVTIRERDTCEQKRINKKTCKEIIEKLISNKIKFSDI
ncbi:glycine--tRNA ligase [Candidatus Woesearchaeota archaeon]|nr:glycine--tRNA ligase [Candidatus Woesearchaeota archaeon]